ncbi:PilN domain-containing protein [Legionella longbeachae]|uniref:Tfp pilus assembly protein PilN n=1 Tax=Legionella longbeachae serogroup 1 (strain NSW150) TaxID=661367 RepID=D3HQQ0_LEGLN|nr:PilN domain-containing protein [Legionella longbeachae]VEE01736.1 Tfp pilus assembly protein PilN [Legionella oakridgensis]HBD7396492.1 PilN domain-containing protein [Legionella pneumophila]ARB91930.1 pilus assembly protein PilN [Legionella longbeachae]ARM34885.1 pilus assembly protein PilN [Legionella longbeachae]EEZ95664.1 type IV pilus assembly protein PilN [Legionella longbeachae D-4968]
MTQINLLPWREQKREQEKKLFMVLFFIVIALSIFIVFLINTYASDLVSNQLVRNQMLQDEIAAMNSQLIEIKNLKKTRELFISRMFIVQHLQSTRTLMVHLFDELINVMPSGIYLTKVEGKNDILSVTGYTESNTYVSILMKNIEINEWIHSPVLSEIKKEDRQEPANNEFKLNFVLAPQFQLGIIR